MKILIVEDELNCVMSFVRALEGFGEIKIAIRELEALFFSEAATLKQELGKIDFPIKVSAKNVVIKMIEEADLILLDEDLERAGYSGNDLLAYCNSKKTISISSHYAVGPVNFYRKRWWDESTSVEFRKLVEKVMAS